MKNRIQKWLHDKLKWGFRKRLEGFTFNQTVSDSFQPLYECKFCDKELAQDSQGNWFHLVDFNPQ
jgi:hypothetical protein